MYFTLEKLLLFKNFSEITHTEMDLSQPQKSLANVCRFCGDSLSAPSMCTYCGFRFCAEHKPTENHQCIKTRYSEYIRKTDSAPPNVATGNFRIVCEVCGFKTSKGVPIEYAGEELIQHMQIVGCSDRVFLEEVKDQQTPIENPVQPDNKEKIQTKTQNSSNDTTTKQASIIDQIMKLSSLKEKGMISDEEFMYIKKELLKKLQ